MRSSKNNKLAMIALMAGSVLGGADADSVYAGEARQADNGKARVERKEDVIYRDSKGNIVNYVEYDTYKAFNEKTGRYYYFLSARNAKNAPMYIFKAGEYVERKKNGTYEVVEKRELRKGEKLVKLPSGAYEIVRAETRIGKVDKLKLQGEKREAKDIIEDFFKSLVN
jgi:hypothetical protein